jgi:hypothetical protein
MKRILKFTLILSFLLTACSSTTRTPFVITVTPTSLKPTLTEMTTAIPSETPFLPLEKQSVTQESVSQFAIAMQKAGININAEQILRQGLKIQTVIGVGGKQHEIVFTHLDPDPSKQGETFEGDYPLLIKSDKGEWEFTTFKNIGDIVGINFGTTVNSGEDWNNPLYWQRVGELGTIAPNGYTVKDVLFRLSEAPEYAYDVKKLQENGSTVRIYNLFYNSDHMDYSGSQPKPNLKDPLWQGAPEIGSPASEEYKAMVREAMDAKIRDLFTQAPYITEIGFANEAIWEYQGNTGWQDSPYYRAFGSDWLAEAYMRTYKIATQEFGRKPGKDLTLFYGDYNYMFINSKADFVFNALSKTKAEIIKRAAVENIILPENPFVVDEQGHLNLTDKTEWGEISVPEFNEAAFEKNLNRFNKIGPVWLGEMTIRGGDRQERTQAIKTLIDIGIKSGVKNFLFWELMQKKGMYANGDLLFDPMDSYKNTATTYELFKLLLENNKE